MGYAGIEAAGVITANGDENKSEAKLNEIREFAKSLQGEFATHMLHIIYETISYQFFYS